MSKISIVLSSFVLVLGVLGGCEEGDVAPCEYPSWGEAETFNLLYERCAASFQVDVYREDCHRAVEVQCTEELTVFTGGEYVYCFNLLSGETVHVSAPEHDVSAAKYAEDIRLIYEEGGSCSLVIRE